MSIIRKAPNRRATEPDAGGALSRVVGRMKGRASRRIGTSGLSWGKVWQPGFYDRALRRNEDLYSAAHYVLANPVRAGLVEHYSEYPLSYSVWEKPARRSGFSRDLSRYPAWSRTELK